MEIIEADEKSCELVYEDVHRSGYSFPCDKEGNVRWEECRAPETAKKTLPIARRTQTNGREKTEKL